MRKLASLTLSLFLLTGTAYADSPKDAPKDSPKDAAATTAKTAEAKAASKSNAEIAAEMEELRQALQAQQQQLQMLKEELAKRDRQIEEAREAAASANSRAAEANSKATEAVTTSAEVKSTATALNTTVANMAASNAAAVNSATLGSSGQASGQEEKGPLSLRYKGITLTPGGFFAAETVTRQRSVQSDVNTAFTQIPYPGNALSSVTETNFSGRQSRLSLLAEGKLGETKLTGYAEADFLSSGTNSNNRQSNSYVFRQRQIWGRVDFASGFAITGGQMWSLVTETKKGIVNRGEALPMTIDAQYNVGFTWARQDAFRLTQTFNDKFALALSVEDPQTTIGGRGFSTLTNFNAGTGATTTATNFFINAPGQSGGLYNAFDPTGYSTNKLPDFIFKAAFDPGWGHYEVFGVVSEFRSRIYPCAVVAVGSPCPIDGSTKPSGLGATNQSTTGGGFGVSASAPLLHKKLDASIKGVYGTGIGRYGSAQLADLTARPDGTLSPIHTAHFLGKLEFHPTPKVDIYAYYGGEYADRVAYSRYTTIKITTTPAIPACIPPACAVPQPAYPAVTTTTISKGTGGYGAKNFNNSSCSIEPAPANTGPSGSGFPGSGSCAGDIRYIAEGTVGFWHRIYQGEKGRVQWGAQYSYIYRDGWSGINNLVTPHVSANPKAVDNMVFTSFRYYLP